MATRFQRVVNLDVRDSFPNRTPFREKTAPRGGPGARLPRRAGPRLSPPKELRSGGAFS